MKEGDKMKAYSEGFTKRKRGSSRKMHHASFLTQKERRCMEPWCTLARQE